MPLLRQRAEAQGMEPCSSFNPSGALHVVQRAAPPAGEILPVGIDVIARTVIEAGVEQLPAATACF